MTQRIEKSMRIVSIALMLVFVTACSLQAQSLKLLWERGTEGDLLGYRVHYGTESGNYEAVINVGDTTEHVFSDLTWGTQYYFTVTAYDTADNESDYSEEVTEIAGDLNEIVHVLGPAGYVEAMINEGDTYYVDRDFQVANIPEDYEGLLWIKTKNSDKTNRDLDISMEVRERLRMFVVHDSRVTPPDWLTQDFSLTDDVIQVTDSGNSNFRVWRSNREYESLEIVVLHDNGTDASQSSMYVVMAQGSNSGIDMSPQASRSGDDIVLSWNEVPRAEYYNLYRGTEPYFVPDTPIATLTNMQYTDVGQGGDTVGNRYYLIEAVRSGPRASVTRRLGKFVLSFTPGRNLASLPVIPASDSLTSVFGDALTGAANILQADRIMKWTNDSYEVAWLVEGTGTEWDGTWMNAEGSAPSTMTVGPDDGFWVEIRPGNPPAGLTFLGQISADTARIIEVSPGMNLIGTTYPVSISLGDSELREDGVATGATNSVEADRILMWTGTGYEVAWLVENSGTEYDGLWMNEAGTDTTTIRLDPGKGYWLHIRNGEGVRIWSYPNPDPGR